MKRRKMREKGGAEKEIGKREEDRNGGREGKMVNE